MYNPHDPHAAFQQLASQAMVASNAHNNNRLSDVSEAPSTMSRLDNNTERDYMSSPASRLKQQPYSPPGKGAASAPHARFSMPPVIHSSVTGPKTEVKQLKNLPSSIAAAAAAQPGGAVPLPSRPNRPSTQSRRSEQAYAARRSVANARVSAAGTVASGLWSGEDEVDDLDWDPVHSPPSSSKSAKFWRWFWFLAPIVFSLVFVTAGVMYLIYGSDRMVHNLQIWRLCFFLAGLPVVWWVGAGVSQASVWVVENSQLFKMQKALYYAYAVRRPLANVIRAALALGLWALAMMAWNDNQDAGVKQAFLVVLKVWACITLCMTANLLKTLLAKMLSSKFNKESHMQKIQDSLLKEYYLHVLLQPRDRLATPPSGTPTDPQSPVGEGEQGADAEKSGQSKGRDVHAACYSPAHLGSTIASSVRGVTNTLFGTRADDTNELGTVAEELLTNSDARSPSEIPTDIEAPPQRSPSTQSLCSTYAVLNRTSSARQGSQDGFRPSNNDPRAGARFSNSRSMPRSGANSLVHDGAPAHRNASTYSQGPRISKLAPVVEEAAVEQARSGGGLTMSQLAKMEAYVRRHALQVNFSDELRATERQEVTSEAEAKKLAFFLFWNVKADLERTYLMPEDVADFLPPGEAEEAFAMLDRNGNGTVTLSECIAAVIEIFEARCDLALSLKDTKTVIGKLENVIGVVVHIIFVFLYMLVFNVDVIKTYLALSSLILAFSFVFQNSIRTMYENVVFLFVVHPFDVGDVLQVGEGDTGVTYKVDQIDLHYTIFLAGNGSRTWFPNQKLMGTPFSNVSASGERGDAIKILVDMDTPVGVLDAVRAACEEVVAANRTEFADGVGVHLRDASNPLKVTIVVGFKYSTNGADGGRTSTARTLMHVAVCDSLTRIGVRYTNPPAKEDHRYVEEVEEGAMPENQPRPAAAPHAGTAPLASVTSAPPATAWPQEGKKTA